MLAYLTPKQRALVLDASPHVSALCPRRAGKTLAAALAALITGEAKPGAVSIIISLNQKQLRRLYWKGGSSGLWTLAHKFNLNVKFHGTYLSWEHENGSMGYLLGADDEEQLEVIRGLEADLYVIDECKSFAVSRLSSLVDEIIDPQRASRQGRIMLIGTPGFTLAGPFWQATCTDARDSSGKPYCIPYGTKDPFGRTPKANLLWSFHHWSLQENTAMPHQWAEALIKKASMGWGDDHPNWVREYLGRWTTSGDGMVFRYVNEKGGGRVTWVPERTDDNPTGLPAEGAPWRLVAGLDLGHEAPTALVVLAYSARLRQIRHVWDYSRVHLLVHEIAALISQAQARFGNIEKIYADAGNLGKTIVNTLIAEYGFPLELAEKREKNDYIELINAAFAQGELLIIEGHEYNAEAKLEEQLLTNVWDLGDEEKTTLARLGKLREDDSIPNDSTDALVYGFRGALHHFGYAEAPPELEYGTPAWIAQWERKQLAAARRAPRADERLGGNALPKAPLRVRQAMRKQERWTTPRQRPRS